MRWFIDLCYLLGCLPTAPIVLYRMWTTGKYRADWDQRAGYVPQLPPSRADRPRIWIHAVSVGEMNAVRGLLTQWQTRFPQTEFVISCTTDTGIARARELFPHLCVIRYPLDFSRFVSRALNRIAPSMIVLVELEVWYQYLAAARSRGIPVAVVNGRLSERSVRRFGYIAPIARRMFASLCWVGAQDEIIAHRFRRMGVPADRVTVTGSLKWDTAEIADSIPGSDTLARAMGITDGPTWVCGSTGPGEEEIILKAFTRLREKISDLQLMLVPRKPERFNEVAELIGRFGFECVRRSQSPDGTTRPTSSKNVQLIDTMGELRKAYSLADVVFVGRTLANMGGSDMMEVAGLAKAMVAGPHTENFADSAEQLKQAQAVEIVDSDMTHAAVVERLASAIDKLLSNRRTTIQMAQRAREVVARNRGATERTLQHLVDILKTGIRFAASGRERGI